MFILKRRKKNIKRKIIFLKFRTEHKINEIFKDKIEDFKKIRQNIIRMSPKTASLVGKYNLKTFNSNSR